MSRKKKNIAPTQEPQDSIPELAYFDHCQDLALKVLAQSGNCAESQAEFKAATSVPQLVAAWHHFWAGILHEVPEQIVTVFTEFYPKFRDDINRGGLYYNEAPPIGTPASVVLIGDDESKVISVYGRHRVYVIGNARVICRENCSVFVNAERARVTVMDNARANCDAGHVEGYGHAFINGKGDFISYDSATVYIVGGQLTTHGHFEIHAYNPETVINSFTAKRINLHDGAQLVIT